MLIVAAVGLTCAFGVLWHFVLVGFPGGERTRYDVTMCRLAGEFMTLRHEGALGPGAPILWLQERLEERADRGLTASRLAYMFRKFPEPMKRIVTAGNKESDQMIADLTAWTPAQKALYASFHAEWAAAHRRMMRFGHPLGPVMYPLLAKRIKAMVTSKAGMPAAASSEDLLFSAVATIVDRFDSIFDFDRGLPDVKSMPAY